ncbi:g1973 [Coccomyxa elongata]
MAKALAADARYISDRVSRAQPLQLQNITKDDANITLHFKDIKPVQVVYFQQDTYPNSPALLMSSDDDDLSGVLQSLNDQFEEYSLLTDVVKAVCSTLGYGADETVLGEIAATQASDEDEFDGERGSEDEEDQGNMWGMGENDDEELIKEVLQKSSRWKRLEDDRVAEEQQRKHRVEQAASGPLGSADRAEQLSYLENMAKRNQIFNMNEAFQMLSKELSEMMQRLDLPWKLDAVQDDAYQWEVIFNQFAESSPLAQDLRELERLHGRGEVCLRLKFKRGLHPFFSPQVQLLRPRCLGPIAGALASHPMLQLSKWDPWRPQRDLLENLRTFLERVARIVVQSPLNSAHIPVSYTRLERLLAHLEALSGSLPACYEAYHDIYSARDAAVDELHLQAMAPMSKRAKTAKEGEDHTNKAWASGTGYGSGRGKSGEVWDARQAASAQDAQDAELRRVMSSLAAALGCDIPGPPLSTSDAGQDAISSDDPDEVGNGANDLSEPEMVSIVSSSCLIPVLESVLSCASFTDISSRSKYYTDILRVAACLCHPRTAHLLYACQTPAAVGGNQASFMQLLGNLEHQAQKFLSVLQSASRARAGSTRAAAAAAAAATSSSAARPTEAQLDMEEEERCSKLLADLIVEVARRAKAAAPASRPVTRSTAAANTAVREPPGSSSEATQGAADAAYIETMRLMQLGFTANLATEKNHKYAKAAGSEGAQPRPRMVRVGKEVAGLNMDLPLNPSSSVFVRIDEQNMTLWQALITGPANTPYENGCFVFDFYFPSTYPSVPPQVNLRTTGGGSVRFNPNLYNCGKVCLSLLGTWSGGQGEGWDAHSSSALQVLVSIQSLILVDEPYFNEPGFEATMHHPTGREQNKRYNLNIREQTMHWAIWQQLKSPPLGFEEVVRSHFRLRKEQVLATCQAWVREAEADHETSASRMKKFLTDIRNELAKL